MENDDKPFNCTSPNCGQRFANSDHLAVHQQKHQLTLKLGLRSVDSLADQTPTPTRFLKTAEEAELFEGIENCNPFDQDFKTAAAKFTSQASVSSSATMVNNSHGQDMGLANTVRTIQLSEVIRLVPQITIRAPSPPSLKTVSESPAVKIIITSNSPSTNKTESKPVIRTISGTPAPVIISALSGTTIPASIAAIIANPSSNVPLARMPVIGLKTKSTVPPTMSAVPHPAIVTSSRALQNGTHTSNMDVKQKLKEVLQMNASPASSQNGVITQTSSLSNYSDYDFNGMVMSSPSSAGSRSPASPEDKDDMSRMPAKRSRKNQEDMDPDQRRNRFLERNRAAASRCRQKRKIWVQQLEKKADDLSVTNSHLQNEIAQLRTEVAQLKGLLLAHKECPVTMQQQKAFIDQVNQVNSATFTTGPETHSVTLHTILPQTQTTTSTAEEVASSALTDMANRVTMEMESRVTGNITDSAVTGVICSSVISQ